MLVLKFKTMTDSIKPERNLILEYIFVSLIYILLRPFGFLLPKSFKLFGFPIFWLWLMKVILEMCHAHYIDIYCYMILFNMLNSKEKFEDFKPLLLTSTSNLTCDTS